MKTLILKTVLPGLFLLTALSAFGGPAPKKQDSPELRKTIHQYFKFPSVLLPMAETKDQPLKVEVLFTTDKNGQVNFVLAKTDDSMLRKEIERQFYQLPLKEVKSDLVHKVVLEFRVS